MLGGGLTENPGWLARGSLIRIAGIVLIGALILFGLNC